MEARENTQISNFITNWKVDFTERIKTISKSRKQDFNFADALKRSRTSWSELDKTMVQYIEFINSNPLKNNDYYKYVNSYRQGKKLNEKYFRHDLNKLQRYYNKIDQNKKYNPFSQHQYEKYVLFMMLKLSGNYKPEYNNMFRVKIDKNREYNPLTSIPSVLRQNLPFEIKEYDIKQAYPSFIFLELNIKPFDVYSLIDKRSYNTLLNTHKGTKGACIDAVRSKLEPIYKERVNEVVTEERFNNKGKLFEDLSKYEYEFIQKFIETNRPENYVRLHDGVTTLATTDCEKLDFDFVQFKVKEFIKPEHLNTNVNFYEIDPDNKVHTSPASYSRFFNQEGFIRITREGHDQITILKNENRIVTPINHRTDLVPFLKDNINEYDSVPIEDRIARDSTNVIQQALQLLNPIPLQYHRDTKHTSDIPFKNGIVRITADEMKLISYDEVNGFFAKHSTQDHEISFCDVDEQQSVFAKFLAMAVTNKDLKGSALTNEDEENISAFCSMFGYLLTNYKDPSFNPAIILSDENADGETRNGGRGKSLLQVALTHFRPSIEKGGNAYDPTYTHVHADLKREHDLYLLDDVPSNFRYDDLYTHITGSIDAQRKGVTAETIPFEDAPKFVISTNWAVRFDVKATSTNRRFKEYKFSNFWNINNTPVDYFGKSFFSDWDKDEWNAFYNFGFYCIQHYLKFGLETIEYDKRVDNFQAYFSNDAILNEAERIFEIIKSNCKNVFSTTDFVEIHKQSELYRYDPVFGIKTSSKFIEAFIEFNKLPYIYCKHLRKYKKQE